MVSLHTALAAAVLSALLVLGCASPAHSYSEAEPTAKFQALKHWIESNKGFVHPSLALQDDTLSGSGLYLTGSVKKGDTLAEVPLSTVMNIEHVLVSEIGAAVEKSGASDQEALSVFLFYEAHCLPTIVDESDTARASFWQPYLDTLPKQLDLSLFWSDNDLMQLLGSPALEYTEARQRAVKSGYDSLRSSLLPLLPKSCDWTQFKQESFAYGLGILWSRVFSIRVRGPSGKWDRAQCLVPLADLMNTGAPHELNADCTTNAKSTHFVCKATRDISTGEQVLAPYGMDVSEKSNVHMLMDYGFVLDDEALKYVAIQASTLDRDDPHLQHRRRALKGAKLMEAMFIPVNMTYHENALAFYRIECAKPASLAKLVAQPGAAYRPLPLMEERCAKEKLASAAQRLSDNYPTKNADDAALLTRVRAVLGTCATNCTRARRTLFAIQLRMGEKEVLESISRTLQRQLREEL